MGRGRLRVGPAGRQDPVRVEAADNRIWDLFHGQALTAAATAAVLNDEGRATPTGHPWTENRVRSRLGFMGKLDPVRARAVGAAMVEILVVCRELRLAPRIGLPSQSDPDPGPGG